MEYFYIIGISIIIIVIVFFLLRARTKKKYEEEYQRKVEEIAQNEAEKIKNITILQCKAETDKLEEIKKQIANNEAKLSIKESTLTSLNSMIKEKENFNSSLQKIREEELNKLIEKEKEKQLLQ
jgi:ABC-type multidrug transport system fused ATPase/permease subunit